MEMMQLKTKDVFSKETELFMLQKRFNMANAVKASPFALSKMYFLQHKDRCIYFAISKSNVKCILQNIFLHQ